MAKKSIHGRYGKKKPRNTRKRFPNKTEPEQSSLAIAIIALLSSKQKPLSLLEIKQSLNLPRSQAQALKKTLNELSNRRKILKKEKRFSLGTDSALLRATLDLTSKGFGFASVLDEAKKQKDVFIAPHNLNGASHDDTILIRITGFSRGRREGRVVKVLDRSITQLCGIFNTGGRGGYVTPDNDRLPYTVRIAKDKTLAAENGMVVLVQITDYETEQGGPEGRVIELLGNPEDAGVQIRMAIEQYKLRTTFPLEVEQEAATLAALITCDNDRKDLTHLHHVTIDGATAKDFDDAICVETTDGGFVLYVSIADVGHYVPAGSAIDKEAYARGTSVYFPDRVLPMLPERLSNDLCSLVPHQIRPAFTAILQFNSQGKRIDQRYTKSLIRSQHRFTYQTVNDILYLEIQDQQELHSELLPMLKRAKRLATRLNKQRMKRGSLGFNIPEATIQIIDNQVSAITLAQRNQAHMLIEEFMLAANEAVAETLARAKRPVLFRIHEDPDPTKLEAFTVAARALGLQLPKTEATPSWFARVLADASATTAEYVVNNLLLRTMQRARYSPENSGHFGLAAAFYLHFTSPIRRYPDLVAHRALNAFLASQTDGEHAASPPLASRKNLGDAALQLSRCEQTAVEVERNVRSRLGALYLNDRIGEEFDAIISGVSSFGLFIELVECFISGAVPVKTMDNDYYLFDGARHRLIGEHTNTIHQLGDQVRVRLDHVDLLSKRITFSLANQP